MDQLQTLVVGAGVLGLAVARRLALSGREVVVIEETGTIGSGISSRNSEVIHAGLYYPSNSLKARCCVAGRASLYRYLEERSIPHQRLGKLIVATRAEQVPRLADLARQAEANGCTDIDLLSSSQAQRMEPELVCQGALWSANTGILDSHQLLLALQGDLQGAGGIVAFDTSLESVQRRGDGFEICCQDGTRVICQELVIAAGLKGGTLCQRINGFMTPPRTYFAKGNYYRYQGSMPFSHLIYPMPERGGLGIHLTLDRQGRGRFGPDVEWVDSPTFDVTPGLEERFAAAVKTYWPAVEQGRLVPDYAGIRPKLTHDGKFADFCLWDREQHGVPGLVALLGIESPGLTSALSLADLVALKLGPL